jgi:hypothetical protein
MSEVELTGYYKSGYAELQWNQYKSLLSTMIVLRNVINSISCWLKLSKDQVDKGRIGMKEKLTKTFEIECV